MSMLSAVVKGRVARPIRALLYGVEGVGKSTWAAAAPAPIFLDAERGTLGLDVARLPIQRWTDFVRALGELKSAQHGYQTVVLDTLDALDRLLVAQVCADAQVGSIEEVGGGYGKGWTQVEERWGRVLEELAGLQAARGMNVVGLAHAHVETFRDPAGADWQRWTLRMGKKSAAIWKGWTEELLFATRDVRTAKREKKGQGGERVVYTKWAPGRDAKNRRNLPERLALDWRAFAAAVAANTAAPTARATDAEDDSMDEPEAQPVAAEKRPDEGGAHKRPVLEPVSEPPPGAVEDDLAGQFEALLERAPEDKRQVMRLSWESARASKDVSRMRKVVDRVKAVVAA